MIDNTERLARGWAEGIKCFEKDGDYVFVESRVLLTPTGRRYTLTEEINP